MLFVVFVDNFDAIKNIHIVGNSSPIFLSHFRLEMIS